MGSEMCIRDRGWIADFVSATPTAPTRQVELFANRFLGIPSQDGDVHVELSPADPTTLYQEVCLVENEPLTWNFYHRGRSSAGSNGGTLSQTIEYRVRSLDGSTTVQSLSTNTIEAIINTDPDPMSVTVDGTVIDISSAGGFSGRSQIAGNVQNSWELVSGLSLIHI